VRSLCIAVTSSHEITSFQKLNFHLSEEYHMKNFSYKPINSSKMKFDPLFILGVNTPFFWKQSKKLKIVFFKTLVMFPFNLVNCYNVIIMVFALLGAFLFLFDCL